jgi:hypothetical protein
MNLDDAFMPKPSVKAAVNWAVTVSVFVAAVFGVYRFLETPSPGSIQDLGASDCKGQTPAEYLKVSILDHAATDTCSELTRAKLEPNWSASSLPPVIAVVVAALLLAVLLMRRGWPRPRYSFLGSRPLVAISLVTGTFVAINLLLDHRANAARDQVNALGDPAQLCTALRETEIPDKETSKQATSKEPQSQPKKRFGDDVRFEECKTKLSECFKDCRGAACDRYSVALAYAAHVIEASAKPMPWCIAGPRPSLPLPSMAQLETMKPAAEKSTPSAETQREPTPTGSGSASASVSGLPPPSGATKPAPKKENNEEEKPPELPPEVKEKFGLTEEQVKSVAAWLMLGFPLDVAIGLTLLGGSASDVGREILTRAKSQIASGRAATPLSENELEQTIRTMEDPHKIIELVNRTNGLGQAHRDADLCSKMITEAPPPPPPPPAGKQGSIAKRNATPNQETAPPSLAQRCAGTSQLRVSWLNSEITNRCGRLQPNQRTLEKLLCCGDRSPKDLKCK